MITLELEGVEIDHCLACKGTWLDSGELEQIAELADVSPGPLSEALRGAADGPRGKRRCPRCRRRLTRISVGGEAAVEIDRCPRQHGLWFDRGEIHALITAFADGEGGAAAALFADLLRHGLGAKGE